MSSSKRVFHQVPAYTSQQLRNASFHFTSTFQLMLDNGTTLLAEKVVRIIPGKRMVVFGTWNGKPVAAKIFFDSARAHKHMQQEIAGITILQENKIPTPALYFQGMSQDQQLYVLLFERIFKASNLLDIWQQPQMVEDVTAVLKSVTIELATQHVLGVLQHDLHLKNFLLTEKTIYTLDGGQVELFPRLLGKKISLKNLALFLAQLGVGQEQLQQQLFQYYAQARGWLYKLQDQVEMNNAIQTWQEKRWRQFQKKIFRNSSDFVLLKNLRTVGMIQRAYTFADCLPFFQDPERFFNTAEIEMLKAGRSSTVIKVPFAQQMIVVKRYNFKSTWHHARRALRTTRAAQCWELAQKLTLFGVATARPIAYIEKRLLGLCGRSYYLTEYIPGGDAGVYFREHAKSPEKITAMIQKIAALLRNLAKLHITHGDLKITNILIGPNDQPYLIDLDGAYEHTTIASLRGNWRKEIKRFLANFTDQPDIASAFKQCLGDIV